MDVRFEEIDTGNCGDCPAVKHCLQNREVFESMSQTLANFALDPEHDDHVTEVYESFVRSGMLRILEQAEEQEISDGATLLKLFRQRTAEDTEHLDSHKQDIDKDIARITSDCEGPLKMRATKASRTIIATICNSPTTPDGDTCESTHIQRETNRYTNHRHGLY